MGPPSPILTEIAIDCMIEAPSTQSVLSCFVYLLNFMMTKIIILRSSPAAVELYRKSKKWRHETLRAMPTDPDFGDASPLKKEKVET